MQKISTSEKVISNGSENISFRLSLFKGDVSKSFPDNEYTIVSETDASTAIMPAGKNFVIAKLMFNLFFEKEVLPENLEAIAEDISKGVLL